MLDHITPISDFGNWIAKREDSDCLLGLDWPKGSKVRQYVKMIADTPPGTPMLVGCSAGSAMQIYVAACANYFAAPGIIYTAKRARPTDATEYARRMGAEIVEVAPGYLSVCRRRARDRAKALGGCVRWSPDMAVRDTIRQCENIPADIRRIVVPTGSGLTAAGVIVGAAKLGLGKHVKVVVVAVSDMASADEIMSRAAKINAYERLLPALEFIRHPSQYDQWKAAILPDGTPLDPYYAAKALEYVKQGDCFWIPGVRAVSSMPADCQQELAKMGAKM